MIVAIHQPEYMPWLGLIDKARRADVLVLLDDVQFNRASIQHRCRIAGPGGADWLTIPFRHRFPQRIDQVLFARPGWEAAHGHAIRAAYVGAPGFSIAWPAIERFYQTPFYRVANAAADSMQLLFDAFGAAPRIMRSSELGAAGAKSDRVLDLCRRAGATRYLCGKTAARDYLDHQAFAAAGIAVDVQDFAVPPYRPGLPNVVLSALDAWMYLGDDARQLLHQPPHGEERV